MLNSEQWPMWWDRIKHSICNLGFRLDCMNKVLNWMELPAVWIIVVVLIMAFGKTWLCLGHTLAQAGCLFRWQKSNGHCGEIGFSILLADTIPTSASVRATRMTSPGVTGEGLTHGRKWGYGLVSFPHFWEGSTQSPRLFRGTEHFSVSGVWLVSR